MVASVLEIQREFDYVNREIDDIYFQYNTLCLYWCISSFFVAISFAEVIKNVKLIIFENLKKVVTRFDKK